MTRWLLEEREGFANSHQNPFAASLDKSIEHHPHVIHYKTANVEAEKLGGVTGAEFEADMRG